MRLLRGIVPCRRAGGKSACRSTRIGSQKANALCVQACECLQQNALLCYQAALRAGLNCPMPVFTPCAADPGTASGYLTFGKRHHKSTASVTKSKPTPVSSSSSSAYPTPTCTCEPMVCAQSWPESCYCENEVKEACYKKCGGPLPVIQVSGPFLQSISECFVLIRWC
jgi:hypothetical protein